VLICADGIGQDPISHDPIPHFIRDQDAEEKRLEKMQLKGL
jgi:hypothetical protein